MKTLCKTSSLTRLTTLTGAAVLPLVGAAMLGTAVVPEAGFFIQSAEAQQGQGQEEAVRKVKEIQRRCFRVRLQHPGAVRGRRGQEAADKENGEDPPAVRRVASGHDREGGVSEKPSQ